MASAASTAMSTAVTTTPSLGSSSSSAATTMSCKGGDHVYKGKITNRSWQQLPPELVRLIATHYLYDVTSSNYCPNTWDAKELWHPRMVYTALRDANELEKLMRTTPTWFTALETHLFWQQACAVLDPHDVLTHHLIVRPPPPAAGGAGGAAAVFQAYRVTPFRHFRNMTQSSCAVCRINCPYSSVGLAVAKRSHPTPTLGMISLCREHRKTMFCGLCLREAPPAECDPHFGLHANNLTGYNQPYNPAANFGLGMGGYNAYSGTQTATAMVCCAENEDDETWPGIETTCRSCRSEWLWRRVSSSSRDREAIAGPRYAQLPPPAQSRGSQRTTNPSSTKTRHFPPSQPPPTKYASADWETRQTVDAFIELGEGSIAEVISIAREKLWLRSQTKMAELMEQAVAATRWAGEGMGVDFAPVNPIQNNTQSSGGNQVVHSEKAPQQVHNEGDAVYSPANSLSPSPPSPRSGQRSRSRSPSPRSAYSSEYEGSEEEDDPELLSLTEDAGGVRELAISDWARARIIDGHWCSPADQWYGFARPLGGGVRDPGNDTDSESDLDEDETSTDGARRHRRVHATHPCPWTLSSPSSPQNPSSPSSASDDEHPRLMTVRAHAPPSFTLCEQAYRAYQKQLKLILLPAMNNLVRRLVIESQTGGGDPAVRAARMEPEEVLAELRTPGVWFDGFDWAASAGGKKEDDTASSTSASTRSDVSHTTSPVLSTTTLQTTPSPPPGRDEDKEKGRVNSGARPLSVAIPIPVSPVLESPKLLHPIPYVPVTLAQMPQYSLEAFKLVWREACAPLYQCRCTVCERAMVKANAAAGHPVVEQVPPQTIVQTQSVQQQPQKIIEIPSQDAPREQEEEEEEEELFEEEEEESEDDLDARSELDAAAELHTNSITPRKRPSGDLDADHANGGAAEIHRSGTPPKRAKTEASVISARQDSATDQKKSADVHAPLASPARQRKRSSEELDLASDSPSSKQAPQSLENQVKKRLRVESSPGGSQRSQSVSPPTSVTAVDSPDERSTRKGFVDMGSGEAAEVSTLRTGLVSGGELDGLYVFEEA